MNTTLSLASTQRQRLKTQRQSINSSTLFNALTSDALFDRLPGIESSGLHANGRYLVHLTSDFDYANHVATGFDDPAVLQVDTKLAQNELGTDLGGSARLND